MTTDRKKRKDGKPRPGRYTTVYVQQDLFRLVELYRAHGHRVNMSYETQHGLANRLIAIERLRQTGGRAPISSLESLHEIKQRIMDKEAEASQDE